MKFKSIGIACVFSVLMNSLAFASPSPAMLTLSDKLICKKKPYATAFQWEAIKSDLTLSTLLCDTRPEYNNWARHEQAFLRDNDKTLSVYFKHAGEREHNDYVTYLVNSQEFTRHRTMDNNYCIIRMRIFNDVMNTDHNNPTAFMEHYHILQVPGYEPCDDPEVKVGTASR